jgi:hypothetical protein
MADISNGIVVPQNRELRSVGLWVFYFRRGIKEWHGLAINFGEFLELDVIKSTLAQFALGDEGGTLTHLCANLTLSHANLCARSFQTIPKFSIGLLILTVFRVHTLEIYSPVD